MNKGLKESVFSGCLALLRPIARWMLRCGVTWKEFGELTKLAYVEAAAVEFGSRSRPASTTRIALASGLGRREVKRLREVLAGPSLLSTSTALKTVNHASRVLAGWHRDPDFRTASGKPRLLPVAGDVSFETLARRYAPDIPPTAVLRELRHVGAVHETPGGKVRVTTRFYMPAQMAQQNVVRSGDVIADFAATVVHNLFADTGETRFEARASSLHVRRRVVPAFQAYLELQAMSFLQQADDWLAERETAGDGEPAVRVGVGIYMFTGDSG